MQVVNNEEIADAALWADYHINHISVTTVAVISATYISRLEEKQHASRDSFINQ